MIDALLIYPKLGSMDSMVVDLPLSLLYAAVDSLKQGYQVEIVDLRLAPRDWRPVLEQHLAQGVRLAGISVMTGSPLRNAREISRYIRRHYPDTAIVWGGPHGTVVPETIEEDFVDFIVRGYGSQTLAELISHLKRGRPALADIAGLSYKDGDRAVHNPRGDRHELINYSDIPYDLVDMDNPAYTRSYLGKRMFPLFTSIGCPYRCSFCVHPHIYEVINGKKWLPYPQDEILEHMELLMERYGATHFCFIDDTSFPDLKRMRRLFREIIRRGWKVNLEFRGARVNEIDRMDDEFLDLMVGAGARTFMVGVESASDRVLKRMQKGISKKQILRVNRKLARHPGLVPHYNFIYGCPGETFEDLLETIRVILQLIEENPHAYIGVGGDWKPIPGTKMLAIAEKEFGYHAPSTMDQWIEMDSTDSREKIRHPWYSDRHNNLIKIMQMSSFCIDDKVVKETRANRSALFQALRAAARLYKPVGKFRLRHGLYQFPVEYAVWRWVLRQLAARNVSAGLA